MFCTNCGSQLADGSKFCPYCSTPVAARPQEGQPQVRYPQDQSQDPYGYPTVPVRPAEQNDPLKDTRGMKWFKFIIYFQLFANAVINIVNAIGLFAGSQYEGRADMVYSFFPALKTADVLFGVCCVALAVFAIYVRQRLAKFRRNGPVLYYILMIASVAFSLLYLVLAGSALDVSLGEVLDANSLSSMVTGLVMLIINWVYFTKRADLFVN